MRNLLSLLLISLFLSGCDGFLLCDASDCIKDYDTGLGETEGEQLYGTWEPEDLGTVSDGTDSLDSTHGTDKDPFATCYSASGMEGPTSDPSSSTPYSFEMHYGWCVEPYTDDGTGDFTALATFMGGITNVGHLRARADTDSQWLTNDADDYIGYYSSSDWAPVLCVEGPEDHFQCEWYADNRTVGCGACPSLSLELTTDEHGVEVLELNRQYSGTETIFATYTGNSNCSSVRMEDTVVLYRTDVGNTLPVVLLNESQDSDHIIECEPIDAGDYEDEEELEDTGDSNDTGIDDIEEEEMGKGRRRSGYYMGLTRAQWTIDVGTFLRKQKVLNQPSPEQARALVAQYVDNTVAYPHQEWVMSRADSWIALFYDDSYSSQMMKMLAGEAIDRLDTLPEGPRGMRIADAIGRLAIRYEKTRLHWELTQ
jgi:hypothetical protein